MRGCDFLLAANKLLMNSLFEYNLHEKSQLRLDHSTLSDSKRPNMYYIYYVVMICDEVTNQ